jgi:hypothetical protein
MLHDDSGRGAGLVKTFNLRRRKERFFVIVAVVHIEFSKVIEVVRLGI